MLQKIDVLLPDISRYGVLYHFSHKLYEALQRAGFSCRLLEGNQRFLTLLDDPPDCTFSFNGALKIDQPKLFCDLIRLPHVTCLVDPPFYFPGLATSRYVVVTCDDLSGCSYLNNLNFSKTFFMPHAVERELAPDPSLERIYDVVMLATFVDAEKRREEWKTIFPAPIWQGMANASELALNEEKTSLPEALMQALGHCLDFHDTAKLESSFYQKIFSEVERYIKARDKMDLLDAIDTTVHVFGSTIDQKGWAQYCKGRPNVIVHPDVPYIEALKIMQQSKIVLNSSIKNKYGAHERVFSGTACGAVVVTNDNPFLREQFTADEEIILYRRDERDALHRTSATIQELLTDEDRRQKIAMQGRQKVLASHTWDQRLAQLLPQITPIIEQMSTQKA